MMVERSKNGVVKVRYQDSDEADGTAEVVVFPEKGGDSVRVEVHRPDPQDDQTIHLTAFDVLAVQAALGLSNVPASTD